MRRTSTMVAGAFLVIGAFALFCLAGMSMLAWVFLGTRAWPAAWPVVSVMLLGGIVSGSVGVRLADPQRTHE